MKRKSKHQKSGKEAPKMSRKLSEEAPNSAYDCMRRVDTTRRHNWTIWRANYEERRRIEREYALKEKFSDEEWAARRRAAEEKWNDEYYRFLPLILNSLNAILDQLHNSGQSDYYSGIDYQNTSVNDLSQNYHQARRENGKFGSHPSEDSYSEESKA